MLFKKKVWYKKVSYYPLECELTSQRMTKTLLQEETGLSSDTITKISKNEDISLKALIIISLVFKSNIQDLIQFK